MADLVYLIKTHRRQIMSIGKKIFKWLQKKQKTQGQPGTGQSASGGGGGGGYAGAAGGYGAQQQQPMYQQQPQQQPYGQQQQQQYTPGQPSFSTTNQGLWDHPPAQGQYGGMSVHPSQMPSGIKPNHGRYNDNEINQKNEHYKMLRAQAHTEGDLMSKAFDGAHQAHAHGDGGRAKQLSNEGHEHQRRMHQANQEAADWIFKANNEDSGPNEVDLHGLYTQEAVAKTEEAIRAAKSKNLPELRVIVGKGIHSKDHVAKVKPAIEKLMHE